MHSVSGGSILNFMPFFESFSKIAGPPGGLALFIQRTLDLLLQTALDLVRSEIKIISVFSGKSNFSPRLSWYIIARVD